jgi:hydroxylamine reductase (hybrid-cluster protein)
VNFQQSVHYVIERMCDGGIAVEAKRLVDAQTAAAYQRRGVSAKECAAQYVRIATSWFHAGAVL